MNDALARLVAPLSSEAFIERHWDREPLVCSRGDAGFADLLTPAEVEQLVSSCYAHYPAVSLLERGQMIPAVEYSNGAGPGGGVAFGAAPAYAPDAPRRIDPDRLFARYRAGASIVLNCVQQGSTAVARFCRELEHALSFPAAVHAILSPPAGQAYHLHFDTTNTFVVQLHGRKRWRIYDQIVPAPVRRTLVRMPEAAPEPCLHDVTMAPGDTLYVPRGFLHMVNSLDDESLSLVIDVEPVTWLDALSLGVQRLHVDARLRQSLPPGYCTRGAAGRVAFEQGFAQACEIMLESLRGPDARTAALATLEERFAAVQAPLPGGRWANLRASERLELDAIVERRPGQLMFARHDGQRISLHVGARKLAFPAAAAGLVEFLCSRERFAVSELPELEVDSKLALARRLLDEGLLVPAGTSPSPSNTQQIGGQR